MRAADAGGDAEVDLGLAELRLLGGDNEVAQHGQFAAAAQGKAVDRGDDRLPEPGDAVVAEGEEIARVHLGIGLVRHLLDVGAGGEGLVARAGQDQAADAVIVLDRIEEVRQVPEQGRVEGIQRLGPVQGHQGITVGVAFNQEGGIGVGHGRLPGGGWWLVASD